MHKFLTELRTQRWDDHRYYHHSRINQSLHLLSAISFLVAYVMMFKDPVAAALIGWLVSMVSRQSGHFFFEPQGYDEVNQRHARVQGSDQGRLQPAPQGHPARSLGARSADSVGESDVLRAVDALWRRRGVRAPRGRDLAVLGNRRAAVPYGASVLLAGTCRRVWCGLTKIMTDPFHDVKLYCKAPLYLLRGELIESPMNHGRARLKHLLEHARA